MKPNTLVIVVTGPAREPFLEGTLVNAALAGFNKFLFIHEEAYGIELKRQVALRVDNCIRTEFLANDPLDLPVLPIPGLREHYTWGSAQALWRARHSIYGPFTVINSCNNYDEEAFARAMDFMTSQPGEFGIMGFPLANTLPDNGHVNRQGFIMEYETDIISEVIPFGRIARNATGRIRYRTAEGAMQPISGQVPVAMGMYCLNPYFFDCLEAALTRFILDYQYEEAFELGLLQAMEYCRKNGWKEIRLIDTNSRCLDITEANNLTAGQAHTGKHPERLTALTGKGQKRILAKEYAS